MNNLDSEVLDICEVSDIAGEVDEAVVITAKIIECQSRIEQCMKGNATGVSATPPALVNSLATHSVVTPPTTAVHPSTRIPKLELPR